MQTLVKFYLKNCFTTVLVSGIGKPPSLSGLDGLALLLLSIFVDNTDKDSWWDKSTEQLGWFDSRAKGKVPSSINLFKHIYDSLNWKICMLWIQDLKVNLNVEIIVINWGIKWIYDGLHIKLCESLNVLILSETHRNLYMCLCCITYVFTSKII